MSISFGQPRSEINAQVYRVSDRLGQRLRVNRKSSTDRLPGRRAEETLSDQCPFGRRSMREAAVECGLLRPRPSFDGCRRQCSRLSTLDEFDRSLKHFIAPRSDTRDCRPDRDVRHEPDSLQLAAVRVSDLLT